MMNQETTTHMTHDERDGAISSIWQQSGEVRYNRARLSRYGILRLRRPILNALMARAQKKNEKTRQHAASPSRILILGSDEAASTLANELENHFPQHYSVMGFVEHGEAEGEALPHPEKILGAPAQLRDLVRLHGIDKVMFPNCLDRLLDEIAYQVRSGRDRRESDRRENARDGEFVAQRVGTERRSQSDTRRSQSATPDSAVKVPRKRRFYGVVKRSADLMFSLAALTVALPFAAPIALAIKLTSRGPVFYSQERMGLNGRSFTIYKLRTMTIDAETATGPVLERKGDVRSTSIGRLLRMTKLDEWPQFYNVLRGEMSIVGPRPERPHFALPYKRFISDYARRHEVRPGLTGLAQVKGGYLTHVYVKLHYDLDYVEQHSCLLDLWIIMRTPITVVQAIRDTPRPAKTAQSPLKVPQAD